MFFPSRVNRSLILENNIENTIFVDKINFRGTMILRKSKKVKVVNRTRRTAWPAEIFTKTAGRDFREIRWIFRAVDFPQRNFDFPENGGFSVLWIFQSVDFPTRKQQKPIQ
jgi:hypothetical protein